MKPRKPTVNLYYDRRLQKNDFGLHTPHLDIASLLYCTFMLIQAILQFPIFMYRWLRHTISSCAVGLALDFKTYFCVDFLNFRSLYKSPHTADDFFCQVTKTHVNVLKFAY